MPETSPDGKLRPVILASASPRRAELLRKAGPEFASMQIMPSDAEEGGDPLENARLKAESVAASNPRACSFAPAIKKSTAVKKSCLFLPKNPCRREAW